MMSPWHWVLNYMHWFSRAMGGFYLVHLLHNYGRDAVGLPRVPLLSPLNFYWWARIASVTIPISLLAFIPDAVWRANRAYRIFRRFLAILFAHVRAHMKDPTDKPRRDDVIIALEGIFRTNNELTKFRKRFRTRVLNYAAHHLTRLMGWNYDSDERIDQGAQKIEEVAASYSSFMTWVATTLQTTFFLHASSKLLTSEINFRTWFSLAYKSAKVLFRSVVDLLLQFGDSPFTTKLPSVLNPPT